MLTTSEYDTDTTDPDTSTSQLLCSFPVPPVTNAPTAMSNFSFGDPAYNEPATANFDSESMFSNTSSFEEEAIRTIEALEAAANEVESSQVIYSNLTVE